MSSTAGLAASGIDWLALARSAVWIAGLTIALAAFSDASWRASVERSRLAAALSRPAFQIPFATGMVLFAAGLAWGAAPLWERLAWLGLLVAFAWQLTAAIRVARQPTQGE